MLKKIMYFFICVIILFIILEGFARIYYYVFFAGFRSSTTVIPSKIEGLRIEPKPNSQEVIDGDILIKFNSYGFRDIEFPLMKKGFRIISLGDSVTAGHTVPLEKTFTKLLGEKSGVEAINAGFSGMNTYEEFLIFKYKCLSLQPDLLLLNICLNDYAVSESESFFKNGKFYWKEKHMVGFWQPIYDRSAFVRMVFNRARKIKYSLLRKPENPFVNSLPRPTKSERNRWEAWLLLFKPLCKENNIKLAYIIFPARPILGQGSSDPDS